MIRIWNRYGNRFDAILKMSATSPRLRIKKPRVRIKIVLLLLAVLLAVGCASNSAKTQGKGTPSGTPEVTVNALEKKVKATINF